MNICIFGDSIAAGWNDYKYGGWAALLKEYLVKTTEKDVYNLAINGDFTNYLLTHLEPELQARDPEVVIFAIGINDSEYLASHDRLLVSIKEFKSNLQKIYQISKKFTSKIIFVGLTRVEESKTRPVSWDTDQDTEVHYNNKDIQEYDKVLKDFCQENDLEYLQMEDLLEIADLGDGLHPTSQGHRKMFEKIKTAKYLLA